MRTCGHLEGNNTHWGLPEGREWEEGEEGQEEVGQQIQSDSQTERIHSSTVQ